MKVFIAKILIFAFLSLLTLCGVFLLENGTSDPFYQRFASPKQDALIIGNSKAAQGIIPSILNKELAGVFDGKLYNYSFTVYNSPFGPAYLESIKNKLGEYDGMRCFIVTVDPWSIASDIDDPENVEKFEENKRFIASLKNVNSDLNLDYFLNWFDKSFYEILLMRMKNNLSKLHVDGWFETTGDMDEAAVVNRRLFMVNFYKDYLTKYSYSETRYKFLQKTITFLQTKGEVFLVRMPLHEDILEIEMELDPNFHSRMNLLADQKDIPYLDFSGLQANWKFKDGLHLTIESAKDFSNQLAEEILLSYR